MKLEIKHKITFFVHTLGVSLGLEYGSFITEP